MNAERRVRLFRNGGNRAVRIPKDFEFDADEVVLRREGDRLIMEPVPKDGLLEFLDRMEPFDEPFPDVDDDLPPLDCRERARRSVRTTCSSRRTR